MGPSPTFVQGHRARGTHLVAGGAEEEGGSEGRSHRVSFVSVFLLSTTQCIHYWGKFMSRPSTIQCIHYWGKCPWMWNRCARARPHGPHANKHAETERRGQSKRRKAEGETGREMGSVRRDSHPACTKGSFFKRKILRTSKAPLYSESSTSHSTVQERKRKEKA